jgi:hypothetical protein
VISKYIYSKEKMAWNSQPTIGFASWNGNATLATTKQLLSTTTGLETEISSVNASEWSLYPALQNVNLSGYSINNGNTLSASNATITNTISASKSHWKPVKD